MERYLRAVVDLAAEKAAVVKPQYAYYAAYGPRGIQMMIRLIAYAKSKGLPVILDAKRGDIGETMARYADEVFGRYGVDACTFIPYLGPTFKATKGSRSWMDDLNNGCMVISMIRTSNPEAEWLQDQRLESGLLVYESLAEGVKAWNAEVMAATENRGRVAGVVGATWPEQAISCREHAGDDVFFLIPGYGAQGGGADGAVAGLPNSRNELMGTVNSSRGITLAWWNKSTAKPKDGDPMIHVVRAIDDANADLNAALARKIGQDPYLIAA
jgi:orotidine-5'-phosphate decarboxylase